MTIVSLNVGGVEYTTSVTTLCRHPQSMLARMFQGDLPPSSCDGQGRYYQGFVHCKILCHMDLGPSLSISEAATHIFRLLAVSAMSAGPRAPMDLLDTPFASCVLPYLMTLHLADAS